MLSVCKNATNDRLIDIGSKQDQFKSKYCRYCHDVSPYATVANSNAGLNLKVNISDTATMLSTYARAQRMIDSLALVQNRIDLKLNISDTASMLSPYTTLQNQTQD